MAVLLRTAACALACAAASAAAAPRSVMYVEGVLDNSYDNATMLAAAHELAASNFDTLIFAFLHVADDGSLVFNNIPPSAAGVFKEAMTSVIRAPNSTVKHALMSIGGAGADGTDYPHIGAHWDAFNTSITSFLSEYKLDGLDLDEEDAWDERVLVNITRLCAERGWMLTGSPVPGEESQFKPLIKSTLNKDGTTPFNWMNVQTYGSDGPSAGQEAAQWLSSLKGVVPASQLQGFIIPGLETPGLPPSQLATFVSQAHKGSGGVGGGFIWDYRLLKFVSPTDGYTAAAYAKAINGAY